MILQPGVIVVTQQPMEQAGQVPRCSLPSFEHVQTMAWKDNWHDCFFQVDI